MNRKRLGSNFDEFLEAEGLREAATAVAAKRVIAFQLSGAMDAKGLTKAEMARRMGTSRAALERLLDPDNASVTLLTLQNAAHAVGGNLEIRFALNPASTPPPAPHPKTLPRT